MGWRSRLAAVRRRAGQIPGLTSPIWKLIGVAVLGLFIFTLFSEELAPVIASLLKALGLLEKTVPPVATASVKALAYATNCTASTADQWEGCQDKTFHVDGTVSTGASGGQSSRGVSVTCGGSGADEECIVEGYSMPQDQPATTSCGNVDPACWIQNWIPGYGDPGYLAYHRTFPEG
ncbi:MAG: hypothetical protein SVU88_04165, partial [Candidatus Nanohaloarchaea archaeon]|nr:hypothetical protein [Candidatus Nanohaloarchaea archaeon]